MYIPGVYNSNRNKTFFFCERRVAQDIKQGSSTNTNEHTADGGYSGSVRICTMSRNRSAEPGARVLLPLCGLVVPNVWLIRPTMRS